MERDEQLDLLYEAQSWALLSLESAAAEYRSFSEGQGSDIKREAAQQRLQALRCTLNEIEERIAQRKRQHAGLKTNVVVH